jgi:hypothetical protein
MSKIKALFGLTMMVVLLAISASPASAWYASTSKLKTSGVSTLGNVTFTTGAMSFTCESSAGEWKIRLQETQEAASEGPHLNILVKKWGKCSPFVGNECEIQIAQPTKGVTTGLLMAIDSACEFKWALCILTLSSAKENKENESLKKITQETSGTNLRNKMEVQGIAGTAKSCLGSGEKVKVEMKGEALDEGVKAI